MPWWSPQSHADRRPLLLQRGAIKRAFRAHFEGQGFTEVECGALVTSPGNETHLHAFQTQAIGPDLEQRTLYLHTSPEFAAKKLLAAGEHKIFEFARVFRNRERGRLHAPEFTMLEWYRTQEPYTAVIDDCLSSSQVIPRRSVEVLGAQRLLHFGVTVSPLRDATRPGTAICLFSDLTTVMELEEQLRFKDALARLGELTAGIAHEFRNGLATIHGYGRLIDPQALPAQYRPYVEGIRQEAEALGKVVTNFLNFARPEQVALAPVDLGAIAQRAVDDLQHDLPAGTRVTVDGGFGPVLGDEVLLRQVFGNLVRNAAEACELSGRVPLVHIAGAVDRSARITRVNVDDNGPGVKEPDRERIFQPFFTTRSRGTGLGLAIVQKVVVMHNGRISVGSSPGGGASFQLAFPLAAG